MMLGEAGKVYLPVGPARISAMRLLAKCRSRVEETAIDLFSKGIFASHHPRTW